MGNPFAIEISDESRVERLIGFATFTDPGNQPGGGSSFPIAVTFTTPAPTPLQTAQAVFNTLAGDGTLNGFQASALRTHPPVVFGIGIVVPAVQVVLATTGVVVSTPDQLDLVIQGYVTDQLGTNVASIQAVLNLPNPVTDAAGTLDLTGATWGIVAGADLSDSGAGNLSSAAGGVYTAAFSCSVNWD